MQKLLIATKNPGKIHELSLFLKDLPVVSLRDIGIDDDVDEDGNTFEENSQKKALFYATRSGLPSLSDDGGLEIDALNGQPGVKSRRWLGYEAGDEELKNHLRSVIDSLPEDNRTARFTTVVSFALPNGNVWSHRGEVTGMLLDNGRTKDIEGYPFRSYFFLPQINKYYYETELTPDERKRFNHRHIALSKLLPIIRQHIG